MKFQCIIPPTLQNLPAALVAAERKRAPTIGNIYINFMPGMTTTVAYRENLRPRGTFWVVL